MRRNSFTRTPALGRPAVLGVPSTLASAQCERPKPDRTVATPEKCRLRLVDASDCESQLTQGLSTLMDLKVL